MLQDSFVPVPQWWFDRLHPRSMATASWFVFIDAAGAALAGIPVAIGVTLSVKAHRPALGLLIGIPPSLYIIGNGLITYGPPNYAAAWVVESLQLLSIGAAVSLAAALLSRLPRTFVRADAL